MTVSSGSIMAPPAALGTDKGVPLLEAFRRHWPDYLKEAAGLMTFMLGAGAFTTLFLHPGSPVQQALPSEFLRHAGLGLVMAFVTAGIIYSPWGQRSGAHINPAVTWSFFRLGKITRSDALFYTLFQFLGAMLAPVLLLWSIGAPFSHHEVRYATTQPGPEGTLVAFVAEFTISFALMLLVLIAMNSERLEKAVGAIVGVLIGVYIAVESPLSGMSLNPARSFGSALTAGEWKGIWLYFVAPVASMLLATEAYLWMRRHSLIAPKEERRAGQRHYLIGDYKEGPNFPVEQPKP